MTFSPYSLGFRPQLRWFWAWKLGEIITQDFHCNCHFLVDFSLLQFYFICLAKSFYCYLMFVSRCRSTTGSGFDSPTSRSRWTSSTSTRSTSPSWTTPTPTSSRFESQKFFYNLEGEFFYYLVAFFYRASIL